MTILDTIVEQKRCEVAQLPARLIAAGDLRDALLERGESRDFLAALRDASRTTHHAPRIALIAEVKNASPSAGVICPNFDPVRIAKEYEAAGASCLSVLTDEQLAKFQTLAIEAGLAALVEVHDEEELERALKISPALIGVNNRNLKTFKVDLATTERRRRGSLVAQASCL